LVQIDWVAVNFRTMLSSIGDSNGARAVRQWQFSGRSPTLSRNDPKCPKFYRAKK